MKKLMVTVCFLLALAALVLFPATAYACPLTSVNGTAVVSYTDILSMRQADGNTIIKEIEHGNLTGSISGPYAFEATVVIHSNGKANVWGIMTGGPASLGGKSGTFTEWIVATVDMTNGTIQGWWVILSGKADFVKLHGQGTFAGTAGVSSSYSGKIYFGLH
jgi:hypothetical protein